MVLIKTLFLKLGKNCSLEIPKGAKILDMQSRAGQVQAYLIFEESAPMEKRCFYVARDNEVVYEEMRKLVYIGSSLEKKIWKESIHLFEIIN